MELMDLAGAPQNGCLRREIPLVFSLCRSTALQHGRSRLFFHCVAQYSFRILLNYSESKSIFHFWCPRHPRFLHDPPHRHGARTRRRGASGGGGGGGPTSHHVCIVLYLLTLSVRHPCSVDWNERWRTQVAEVADPQVADLPQANLRLVCMVSSFSIFLKTRFGAAFNRVGNLRLKKRWRTPQSLQIHLSR